MAETQSNDPEQQNEAVDLSTLSFQGLQSTFQEAQRLASTTFHQTDNGFENALGQRVSLTADHKGDKTTYRVVIFKDLQRFHEYLSAHGGSVLALGSENKLEMMRALRTLVENLGNRIIE